MSIDLHGEARDAVVERPRVASDDRFLSETDAGKKTKREHIVEGSERARTESPPQPLPDLNPWSKLEGL